MDLLRASCPTRLLKQGKLKQLAQDHVQLGFEYLHRRLTPQLLWAKLMKDSLLQLPTSTHSVAVTSTGSTGSWFYHLILLLHQVPTPHPHQDLLQKSQTQLIEAEVWGGSCCSPSGLGPAVRGHGSVTKHGVSVSPLPTEVPVLGMKSWYSLYAGVVYMQKCHA